MKHQPTCSNATVTDPAFWIGCDCRPTPAVLAPADVARFDDAGEMGMQPYGSNEWGTGEYVLYRDHRAAVEQMAADLATLRQRAEAAEADAARYRWLRENCTREWESDMSHNKGAPSLDIEFEAAGHDLDAAIDAAMKEPNP